MEVMNVVSRRKFAEGGISLKGTKLKKQPFSYASDVSKLNLENKNHDNILSDNYNFFVFKLF